MHLSELREKLKKNKDDPCWKDYVQVGMKKKNGKEVPNCVPKEGTEEGTDFASHRAKPNLTKGDAKKMGAVADMLRKEREKKAKKEEVDEAAGPNARYTASEIKKRQDARKERNAGTTQAQRMKNKMYGNMMGGLKKEEADTKVDEATAEYSMGKAIAKRAHEKQKKKDAEERVKARGWVRNSRGGWSKPTKEEAEQTDEAKDYNAEIRRQKDIASKQRGKMSKATSHADMVDAMNRHMKAKKNQKSLTRAQAHMEEVELDEKAVSKSQQKFFGMVRAKQKGEMDDASPEVAKAAKSMSKKDVKDFAKTKHKGLPDKKESVKEEFVVKYAKSKKGIIYQQSFKTQPEAEKFLAQKKKEGMNGLVSKKGVPVSMQKFKDMQKD